MMNKSFLKKLGLIVVVVTLVLSVSQSAWGGYQEGKDAVRKGDFKLCSYYLEQEINIKLKQEDNLFVQNAPLKRSTLQKVHLNILHCFLFQYFLSEKKVNHL